MKRTSEANGAGDNLTAFLPVKGLCSLLALHLNLDLAAKTNPRNGVRLVP